MKISDRRMGMYQRGFLAAFDNNWRNSTSTQIFAAYCDEHGLPEDERNQFMQHLQKQGVL